MNTPAHLIIAAALYAQPSEDKGDSRASVTGAALLGGFLPDFSLYFAFLWSTAVLGRSPDLFFGSDYFSPALQGIFAIDNSFLVWGGCLAVALVAKRPVLIACCGSALAHIALDFPLHHDDGRPHFWPVSDWVFRSPVSYWDPQHFGNIAGFLEILLCLGLLVILFRRFRSLFARSLIAVIALAQIFPVFIWVFVFSG